jgi:thioredoxin reductase (NADPH)
VSSSMPLSDDPVASPTLDDAELALLETLGTRRSMAVGEYLYREGDTTYDFYAIRSGATEIVVHADGEERCIVRHGPGRFLGELNLLTGQRVYVSARVVEPGEVIVVPRSALQNLLATNPGLGDTILAAFVARRSALLSGASAAIRVVGSRFSPELLPVREFLARNRIPHEWLDPDRDAAVDHLLSELGVTPRELPIVIVSGSVLRRPTPGRLS